MPRSGWNPFHSNFVPREHCVQRIICSSGVHLTSTIIPPLLLILNIFPGADCLQKRIQPTALPQSTAGAVSSLVFLVWWIDLFYEKMLITDSIASFLSVLYTSGNCRVCSTWTTPSIPACTSFFFLISWSTRKLNLHERLKLRYSPQLQSITRTNENIIDISLCSNRPKEAFGWSQPWSHLSCILCCWGTLQTYVLHAEPARTEKNSSHC